jgi:nucleoid DNA-binding protein
MKLEAIVGELLQSHECVMVPELGGFVAQYKSAQVHPITHLISPPAIQIGFNKHLNNFDGLLSSTVSQKLGISLMEANYEVAQWVKNIQSHLAQGHKALLPGLGVLWIDHQGQTQFIPTDELKQSAQHFGLQPVALTYIDSPAIALHNASNASRPAMGMKKWIAIGAAALTVGIGFFAYSSQHPQMDFAGIGNWGKTPVISQYMPRATQLTELQPEVASNTETELQKLWNTTAITHEAPITKTVQPESASSKNVWGKSWVVGGVFKTKENAELLLQSMKQKGFKNAVIIPFQDYYYACYGTASSEKDEALLRAQVQRVDPRAWTKR